MSSENKMKNIGGDANDAHYRYKRNVIEVQRLNKQGGLTEITNMDLIIKQLKVPDEFALSFYKRVQKKGHGQVSPGVFRGTVEVSKLEKILDKMIKKYVLCPKCGLPEWNRQSCKACGHVEGHSLSEEKVTVTSGPVVAVSEMTKTQKLGSNTTAEAKIVTQMKKLYSVRDVPGVPIIEVERLLDRAWNMGDTEENAEILERETSMLLGPIGI